MTNAIHLLPYILSAFSYLLPICWFLPFKMKPKEKIPFFFLLLANILLIAYKLGNIGVVFLIVSSCMYICFINKNYFLNICVFIATYLFCVLWDNIFSLLWDTFVSPISQLLASDTYFIMYIIVYLLILAAVCPLLSRALHYLIRKIHTAISKQLLVLIAANLVICLFIFLFNIVIGESIGYNRQNITFNCVLFGCYFIINTVLIINIIKAHMSKVELDMRQEAYERLQEYTNQIENMYASLRSFKHDYLNIMLSMSGYIESGDISGLKTYFDEEIIPLNRKLSANSSHLNQLMNIKITELKSIISAKLLYAMELNIAVSIEVLDELTEVPMDIVDLCRIIGIYLDNAIEAAQETDAPSIQFASINLENEYVFIVANTFLDRRIPYAMLKQPNVSTKGANRGIGLYNAHEIISKYNYVFWDTETKDSRFIQRLKIIKQQ